MKKHLNKYDYLNYKRCPRLLALSWIDFPIAGNGVNQLKNFLTAQGKEVGLLAQGLFKDKTTYTVCEKNTALAVIKTKEALTSADIVFEGAFEHEDLITRPDILNPNATELIEIKSTTEIKDEHILDVAFQKYVLDKSGLQINTVKVGHVNKQYILDGTLDLNEFFTITDVTEIIIPKIFELENDLAIIKDIIASDTLPERIIGRHCSYETDCPYKQDCWGEITNDTILNLRRDVSGKKYNLHAGGVRSLKDIPEYVSLTKFQSLQKEAEIQNGAVINQKQLPRLLLK